MTEEPDDAISHYLPREDGMWLLWHGLQKSIPSPVALQLSILQRSNGLTVVNSRLLHGFKTARGREWDCINGWRDGIGNLPNPEARMLKTYYCSKPPALISAYNEQAALEYLLFAMRDEGWPTPVETPEVVIFDTTVERSILLAELPAQVPANGNPNGGGK